MNLGPAMTGITETSCGCRSSGCAEGWSRSDCRFARLTGEGTYSSRATARRARCGTDAIVTAKTPLRTAAAPLRRR